MARYVITDGKRWIKKDKKGRYLPTTCGAFAEEFSKDKADKVLNNSLAKGFRSIFRVERADDVPKNVKPVSKDFKTEKVQISENITRWIDKVESLNGLFDEVNDRNKELIYELSKVDKELSDLLHYMEFAKLNAAQGYKAYKMVKERRIKRRHIKNEMDVLAVILSQNVNDISKNIKNKLNEMDKRTYNPREIEELFD